MALPATKVKISTSGGSHNIERFGLNEMVIFEDIMNELKKGYIVVRDDQSYVEVVMREQISSIRIQKRKV